MKKFAILLLCMTGLLLSAYPQPDAGAAAVLKKYAEAGKNYKPRSGKTAFFARTQLKYGLQRADYLHRWTDRPLWQDSSFADANNGRYINPRCWEIMFRTAKRYGLDGYSFFPIAGGRDQFFETVLTPGYQINILPELISKAPFSDVCRIVDLALKCPQVYRVNGKFIFTSYPGDRSPEYWVKLKKDLTAKYGDIFLLLPMHNLSHHISFNKKTFTASDIEQLADCIREWLRSVDGYYYNYPPLNEFRYYDKQFDQQVMIPLLRGILSEPEFKDKYLAWGTKSGHENYYEKGSYTYNCGGTSMLRGSVGSAVEARADIVNLVEWDEENENTHFRPTIANGFATKRVIRHFVSQANNKTLPPLPGDDLSIPDVILSYRRTLVAGETLACEVIYIPDGGKTAGTFPVTLKLKNSAGKVVRSFSGTFDRKKLGELRFNTPVADILDTHLLIPELTVDGKTFSRGFTPIELRANYNGDNKWFKHPVRDIADCQAELKAVKLADGKVRIDGKLTSASLLHQVTLLDSGAEIWIDNYDPAFQESPDRVVVKVTFRAKQKSKLGFFGTIRIINAKNLKLMTYGYDGPRNFKELPDGWELKGVLGNNFNGRQMVFSFDRSSLADAVVNVNIGIRPIGGAKHTIVKENIRVEDIVKKNIYVFSGKFLSHLVFHHNDQPVKIPRPGNKKELTFSVFCTPALPQSVFFIEAFDVNRKFFRSAPVTIYRPAGKKAVFSAYDMFAKKAVSVRCDEALLTPQKFIISDAHGAAVKNTGGNQLNGVTGTLAPIINSLRYLGESGYGNIAMKYLMKQPNDHNGSVQTVKDPSGKFVWKFDGKQNIAFPTNTIYPYSGFELKVKLTPENIKGTQTIITSGHAGFTLELRNGVPRAEFFRGNELAGRSVVSTIGNVKLKPGQSAEIIVRFDQKHLQIITNASAGKKAPCSGYQLYPQSVSVGLAAKGNGFTGTISELNIRPL